jgi:hypothetical protein
LCFDWFGIVRYDRDASRYHKGVYARKRRDLVAALDATLSPLFLGQLKNVHKSCLVAFKQELLEGLRGDDYSFSDVVAKARETCEGVFTTGAKEALVEGTDWTWEEELELLKEEAKIVSDQCRKDETKKMLNQIEVCSPLHLQFAKSDCVTAKYQEKSVGTSGVALEQGF